MRGPDDVEEALSRAVEPGGDDLTAEEREALREVLHWWRTWKAWGRLGRIILWTIVTMGAVAAAIRELRGVPWH